MKPLNGRAAALASANRRDDLSPLLSEMRALAGILPVFSRDEIDRRNAQRMALDAEIEARFDNVPV